MTGEFRVSGLIAAIVAVAVSIAGTPAHADSSAWANLDGQRGVVVLMRHALAPGGGDPAGFRLGECRTQRNLSQAGRDQARRIGEVIADSGVRIAAVLSSPWCRSRETATLLGLGPVSTRAYLGSTFTAPSSVADRRESRTRRLIESHRDKQGVLILVGHYANILDLTGLTTDSGEGIAVRMNRDGKLQVLQRLPAA